MVHLKSLHESMKLRIIYRSVRTEMLCLTPLGCYILAHVVKDSHDSTILMGAESWPLRAGRSA